MLGAMNVPGLGGAVDALVVQVVGVVDDVHPGLERHQDARLARDVTADQRAA